MILVLQVLLGLVLGFVFLVGFVRVGTWLTYLPPTDVDVEAFRAQQQLRAIRRESLRQMLAASRAASRNPSSGDIIVIEVEDDRP